MNVLLQEIGKVVFDSKWPVACWIICSISSSCSFGMKSASRHYSGVRDSKRSYMVSDSSIQMSQRAYSGVQQVDGFKGLQSPEDHFFPDGYFRDAPRSGTRALNCGRASTKQTKTLLDTAFRLGKTVGMCKVMCSASSAGPRCGKVMT